MTRDERKRVAQLEACARHSRMIASTCQIGSDQHKKHLGYAQEHETAASQIRYGNKGEAA